MNNDDHFKSLRNVQSPEVVDKVDGFMKEFLKYSWLMTVAFPKMVLNFNVKGKRFDDVQVKERFVKYSAQDDVSSDDLPVGTVYLVAWPSVDHLNGSNIWKKGEVVVVSRSSVKMYENDFEDMEHM